MKQSKYKFMLLYYNQLEKKLETFFFEKQEIRDLFRKL